MENTQIFEIITNIFDSYKSALGFFLGWFVAICVGGCFADFTKHIQKVFRESLSESRSKKFGDFLLDDKFTKATAWLGSFEVSLFYICLLFRAEGIGVWLIFKVAAKWESWGNIIKMPTGIKYVDNFEYLIFRNKLATTVMQKFLIGTIGNILAAAIGVGLFCIIKYLAKQTEVNQMVWMIGTPWFWLCFVIAIIFSTFWGIYGCKEAYEQIEVENKGRKMYLTKRIGIFSSGFFGSLVGWACLYVLIVRLRTPDISAGSFDVFLGTVAVLGITGYSYRIVDAFNKKAENSSVTSR